MSWTNQLWKREPILKAKKITKKDAVTFTAEDGTTVRVFQEIGEAHEAIKKDYINWENKCKGLKKADIGVTGGAGYTKTNRPPDKSFEEDLLSHLENHVTSSHARKGKGSADNFKRNMKRFKEILGVDTPDLVTEEDIKELKEFKEDLLEFWDKKDERGLSANPRNIPFKVPTGTKKDTKTGKYKITGEKTVYGHYRTPEYVKARKRMKGTKESKAVPSSWYSESQDTAKPPMYLAMFAGSSKDNATSDLVGGKGLLGIVEEFEKMLDPKITHLDIDVTGLGSKSLREGKADNLSSFGPYVSELQNMMKNEMYFKKDRFKRNNYVNTGKLLGAINSITFNVSKKDIPVIIKFAGSLERDGEKIEGIESLKTVKFRITAAIMNRTINKIIRSKGGNNLLAPNSKFPFILSSAGDGRKGSWVPEFNRLMEAAKPKKEVKKSWTDMLWT